MSDVVKDPRPSGETNFEEHCAESLALLAADLRILRDVLLHHRDQFSRLMISILPGVNPELFPS